MADEIRNAQKKSLIEVVKKSFREVGETFVNFFKAPRALWGINIPYIIEGLVYFGILTILGKFCSENVGLSDIHSGWVYSAVTGGITFAMLVLGGVSDKIGVRLSLALSLAIMMVGRVLVAISGTLHLGRGMGSVMFFVMAVGLLLMVSGYGFYQPAAYAGVKRYTNPKTAAVAYAVIYGLMNMGAFLSGLISPLTRHHFEKTIPPNGLASVFWLYSAFTLIASILTVIIITKRVDQRAVEQVGRETTEMKEAAGQKSEKTKKEPGPRSEVKIKNLLLIVFSLLAITSIFMGIGAKAGKIGLPFGVLMITGLVFLLLAVVEFLRQRPDHPFRDRKFVFFIFILIPVQTLFAHQWLTIPYYCDRAFRGTAVSRYFEFFSNLNPILIFVLAPLIAALTAKTNVYRMMIAGTLVMALPTFFLAAGPNTVLFLSYVLLMSIGEAMWQPRFLQWIAEIAPEGKTGQYMGIGQFPWFLTKVITGLYSGYFIEKYCPKPELNLPINTGKMWLLYSLIAMVSPITLILARKRMLKSMTRKS